MEEKLQHDNVAEVALSAMVSMIMILLFSAIVAGMALMMIEQAFMESRTQSVEQSETLKCPNRPSARVAVYLEDFLQEKKKPQQHSPRKNS